MAQARHSEFVHVQIGGLSIELSSSIVEVSLLEFMRRRRRRLLNIRFINDAVNASKLRADDGCHWDQDWALKAREWLQLWSSTQLLE